MDTTPECITPGPPRAGRAIARTARLGSLPGACFAPVLLCLAVAWGASLAAQEPPVETAAAADRERPELVFGDEIAVKVINVQVFVRDKKTGEPITGLTVDDFELYEDGRPMPITNFYEYRDGQRTDRDPEEEDERRLDPVTNEPQLRRDPLIEVPPDERLHLIVYVDHFNIRPQNRNKVFRHLREFLRTSLDRSDRVMLVSYNRSVKMERGFTSDATVISRALVELEKHTGGRVQYDSERRDLLRELEDARDPSFVEGRIRLFAESVYNDLQFTLDGLKEMVNELGGVPGRKAFLYVSDGLPMRAGEEMFHAAEEKLRQGSSGISSGFSGGILDALQYDASRRFTELTRTANANDVTFYTLDAAGLRTNSMRGADVGYQSFSTNIDSIANSNMQSSIMFMADETGGTYTVNTNNFSRGFDRVAQDFDHYYSLGYAPGHAGSGRSYNIEVKLKDKQRGVEIRYRNNYRDKPVETEMVESTLASLKFGFQSNDLGILIEPTSAIPREDGTYMVNVDVKIPIGNIVMLPVEDRYEARMRVWIQAADRDGGISPPAQTPVNFTVPEADFEAAKDKYWVYTLPLMMKPGDQRLSIGVRDDLAGTTSFVNRSLRVGS